MKIAICSQGPELDSMVDQRFGRCPYFVLVNHDSVQHKAVPNPGVEAMGGVGVKTAQFLENTGVEAVLVGNIGPKAIAVLNAAGIKVYAGIKGTVADAISQYKEGRLNLVSDSTAPSHFGLGGGRGFDYLQDC